ncbi:MAG: hypothetical protein IKW98_00850 [Prevotella sp.]|nr:hypothetical protein [Prevotella sp.]
MRRHFFILFVLAAVSTAAMSCSGKVESKSGDAVAEDSMVAQTAANKVSAEDDEFLKLPQAERDTLAVQLIEEFYSHAPKKGEEKWDESILRRYLAPQVLKLLKAEIDSLKAEYKKDGSEFDHDYATWRLMGTDDTGMVILKRHSRATMGGDGRYTKDFEVCYWGDAMLSAKQTLSYTVGGPLNHLQITWIDGMNGDAANEVWKQVELREEWREMESEMKKNGELDEEDDD